MLLKISSKFCIDIIIKSIYVLILTYHFMNKYYGQPKIYKFQLYGGFTGKGGEYIENRML